MKNLLNDFISSTLINEKSAQKAFNEWKHDFQKTQQEEHRLNMLYLQNHYQPRLERDIAVDTYIKTLRDLRKKYYTATPNTRRKSLRKWLKFFADIPQQITDVPSAIFTRNHDASTENL